MECNTTTLKIFAKASEAPARSTTILNTTTIAEMIKGHLKILVRERVA